MWANITPPRKQVMTNAGYAQELTVNFVKLEDKQVILLIREIEKILPVNIVSKEKLEKDNFVEGEKLRLLYLDKNHWELRRFNIDMTVEKYLRRED